MSIFVRIWFAFSLVLLVGSYLIISSFQQQIKPNIRQVVEDTLAENANLLAALVTDDMIQGRLQTPEFDQKIQHALERQLNARIWKQQKDRIYQTVYITDSKGMVVYDSTGSEIGKDYSRWNDVYLTLRGKYGARSTRTDPNDANSSTMYVAAPLMQNGHTIGVLSVGKPGLSVQPYIEQAQRDVLIRGLYVVAAALFQCTVVAWWLRRSINKVRRYALGLAAQDLPAPYFHSAQELNDLSNAIERMRDELEDRAYVEQYVHTLTHELKSPLTAIQASAELLQDELPIADQQYFARQIGQQADRLRDLIERLLLLVKLEKRHGEFNRKSTDLIAVIKQVISQRQTTLQRKKIQLDLKLPAQLPCRLETFWMGQAIGNVLDNAIEFCPAGGQIDINLFYDHAEKPTRVFLNIVNQGPHIPDYALTHIFERYYSLPRPDTGHKSTGLGLTLVREVMEQHQGWVRVQNEQEGVSVLLSLGL